MRKSSNIILITVDCLRADHLGFMGYSKNISPNIDSLAKESIVFKNAFSTGPSTPYSFPAILTSTYPMDYQGPQRIERPRVLISEVLKDAGFITAAFHSVPFLSEFFGYNKGWDYFEDITLPTGKLLKANIIKDFFRETLKNILISLSPRLFLKIKYRNYLKNEAKQGLKIKASFMNQLVKDFILSVKNKDKPFFLWVHYMDVHGPYLSEEHYYQDKLYSFDEAVAGQYINYLTDYGRNPRMKRFLKSYSKETQNMYDQGVKCADRELGKLFAFLKDENIYDDTVVCLTADHGEELFDHQDGVSHLNCKLYNELLHVPLIIKTQAKPQDNINPVSLIDLAPTVCSLAGVNSPEQFKGVDLFGGSFSPIFHQAASHIGDSQISSVQLREKLKHCNVACQSGDWKYILDKIRKSEELYNLVQDPKEENNVIKEQPAILSAMRKKIEEFKNNNPSLVFV